MTKLTGLDVLKDVALRLERSHFSYMLTGSVAMTYYAEPGMTRDIKEALNKSILDFCILSCVNGTSLYHYCILSCVNGTSLYHFSEHEQKKCDFFFYILSFVNGTSLYHYAHKINALLSYLAIIDFGDTSLGFGFGFGFLRRPTAYFPVSVLRRPTAYFPVGVCRRNL